MLEALSLFAQQLVLAYGLWGTFTVAVLESFIFPVPTAVIIFPATALGADPLTVVLVATVGSVLGAMVGYALGLKYGKRVADRYFSKWMGKMEQWYEKYGIWVVFLAAFTPIPFKVVTWFSGICRMDFWKFVLISIPGRLLQFLIFAYLGSWLGLLF